MKLVLFAVSIFVFGCSAGRSTSVEDQLQRMNLEIATEKKKRRECCESSEFGAAAEIGKNVDSTVRSVSFISFCLILSRILEPAI